MKRSGATRLRHRLKRVPGARQLHDFLHILFRPTYREDGLRTVHSTEFMRSPKFLEAWKAAEGQQPGTWMRWRLHVVQWAAANALQLEGDFVGQLDHI